MEPLYGEFHYIPITILNKSSLGPSTSVQAPGVLKFMQINKTDTNLNSFKSYCYKLMHPPNTPAELPSYHFDDGTLYR